LWNDNKDFDREDQWDSFEDPDSKEYFNEFWQDQQEDYDVKTLDQAEQDFGNNVFDPDPVNRDLLSFNNGGCGTVNTSRKQSMCDDKLG
jgi:hypothetical protein